MKRTGLAVMLGVPVVAAGVACVLADPPPIDQLPPQSRPLIVGDMVDPPTNRVIQTLTGPSALTVTVGVAADPNEPLTALVVEDFDPSGTNGNYKQLTELTDGGVTFISDTDASEAIQLITKTVQVSDPTHCHTITFVVAAANVGFLPSSAIPITPPGGDSVSWIYQPGDCTLYDAGPPTFQTDAADDEGGD